jgi:2-polyprenyl-6-methoxyphenol hydroxylase-like FAD-dependent oxidoreductase
MRIAIIGAGPAGLFLGSALARRGHQVTAVDRDPGPADAATWPRRGVMQFHHAHAFRQTVVEALEREVPEALDQWLAAGVEPIELPPVDGTTTRLGLRSSAPCVRPPWPRPASPCWGVTSRACSARAAGPPA